jgi:hypothetical protein
MFTHKKKNIFFFLVILITLSAFLRFYNLNWGAPFYFHPDERNIASSVSQLSFPAQMNPHFFAYGSLPIYAIYFTGIGENLINFLLKITPLFPNSLYTGQVTQVSFAQAIVISRFFSALFSLALIPLLFFIGKKLKDERTGLIAAFLASVSTGLIQFAHFGTFEIWLTILSVLLFLFTMKLIRKSDFPLLLTASVVLGAAVATKVSHLMLLPLPIFAIAFSEFYHIKKEQLLRRLLIFTHKVILFLAISLLVFFITNPFVFFTSQDFVGSIKYESGVALGTMHVFYTGEFVNALPIVFQFIHIYPFLLNPLMTILFIPSFFLCLFIAIKHKRISFLLLTSYFLLLFLSQAFLYAKWTRYMVPTLPFAYLICAIAFADFWKFLSIKRQVFVKYLLLSVFFSINCLFAISFFLTAFIQEDTRIAAKKYALQYIPSSAPILSEVYDLGITPFNDSFHNITLYNFYDLDNNSSEYTLTTLGQRLAESDYIILPSQRIMKTRLQEAKAYPLGHVFYSELLTQANGFEKIYETPCDLFCKIAYLSNPIYSFEETASVFDRPTVMIFKKK